MRKFLVLCLAAFIGAVPQYNYNQPSASHSSGIISAPTHGSGFLIGGGYGPSHGSGSLITNGFGPSISNGGGPVILSGGNSGISSHDISSNGGHQGPIVTKNFYIHSAPEEHSDAGEHKVITIGVPRRNYRVVFIKAPSQSGTSGRVTLQQAPQEDKTVIYVLTKKTDISDIQASIQSAPIQSSKPEVFFIKYKTPAEAAHAQHQIQAQYDSLGGTSQVSDEGFAPVSSVIGSLGNGPIGNGHSHSGAGSSAHGFGLNNNYLPPN